MKRLKRLKQCVLVGSVVIMACSACKNDSQDYQKQDNLPNVTNYPIVETGQTLCFDNKGKISTPLEGADFFGQDGSYTGNKASYTDNGDGTITDNITGLMWQKTTDINGDGQILANDKLTLEQALSGAEECATGEYADWRLPSIKELYSLIDFMGTDPSSMVGNDVSSLTPFINSNFFDFAYGDISAGERVIDAQYASSTKYIFSNLEVREKVFGVNFADGRIKGYDLVLMGKSKTFFVMYVRGNKNYGINSLIDNGDGTITDVATNLMWMQSDSEQAMSWQDALEYAETSESEGYNDWRLPNAKELQSLVDYERSPDKTSSAAISPLFNSTKFTNEGGNEDYPYYWSSTTHMSSNGSGGAAAYICFGRALGYMTMPSPPEGQTPPEGELPPMGDGGWTDVHGAGSQRSDPKLGNPDEFPNGFGPQGDAIRIYNYVRLVRKAN